jgi:hypothetical protein
MMSAGNTGGSDTPLSLIPQPPDDRPGRATSAPNRVCNSRQRAPHIPVVRLAQPPLEAEDFPGIGVLSRLRRRADAVMLP